jgi:Uma2 family endonuclease
MAIALTRKRFTAEEYQRMGRAGILAKPDRVELINGEIVAMTPIGPRHDACVITATRAFVRAAGDDALVLPQGSVRLDLYHEPQPDLVLLRPRPDSYTKEHAGPEDILLIVEIAGSSLDYDREVKTTIYAAARIPEYWLADLATNVVSRYSAPEGSVFSKVEQFTRGLSIAPALLPSCVIAVDDLLTE